MILTGARVESSVIERAARSVPIVVVSRPIESDLLDTVNNDDHLGATMAVEHLIALGHRHICHIDGGRGGRSARSVAPDTRRRCAPTGWNRHVVSSAFTEASGAAGASERWHRAGRSRRSSPATTSARSAPSM